MNNRDEPFPDLQAVEDVEAFPLTKEIWVEDQDRCTCNNRLHRHPEDLLSPATDQVLDQEQRARVEALIVAKSLLTTTRIGGTAPPSTGDLVQVAEWIISGWAKDDEARQTYPLHMGDVTLLGPEIFASEDGRVICWQGQNYVVDPEGQARDFN